MQAQCSHWHCLIHLVKIFMLTSSMPLNIDSSRIESAYLFSKSIKSNFCHFRFHFGLIVNICPQKEIAFNSIFLFQRFQQDLQRLLIHFYHQQIINWSARLACSHRQSSFSNLRWWLQLVRPEIKKFKLPGNMGEIVGNDILDCWFLICDIWFERRLKLESEIQN